MNLLKHLTLAAALLGCLTACTTSRPGPGTEGDGDFTIGPDYTNAPELIVRPGMPAGTVYDSPWTRPRAKFIPASNRSPMRIQAPRLLWQPPGAPGADGTTDAPYRARCWSMFPPEYAAGKRAPFLVVQDGRSYRRA